VGITTVTYIAEVDALEFLEFGNQYQGISMLSKFLLKKYSVCGSTVVDSACYTVPCAFPSTIIAQLALFELASIRAVSLLFFLFQISALGHSLKFVNVSLFTLLNRR
tara:strand:- start:311 stop:631 length:321 start_codon:yes stop_codon:yes gene_type:complete